MLSPTASGVTAALPGRTHVQLPRYPDRREVKETKCGGCGENGHGAIYSLVAIFVSTLDSGTTNMLER